MPSTDTLIDQGNLIDDAKYWFTKAAIEALIAKACENYGLPQQQHHAQRAVYFTAKGIAALALTLKDPPPSAA